MLNSEIVNVQAINKFKRKEKKNVSCQTQVKLAFILMPYSVFVFFFLFLKYSGVVGNPKMDVNTFSFTFFSFPGQSPTGVMSHIFTLFFVQNFKFSLWKLLALLEGRFCFMF